MKLNNRNVDDMCQLYTYSACLITLLNYNMMTKVTCLLCKIYIDDITWYINVFAIGKNNICLNILAEILKKNYGQNYLSLSSWRILLRSPNLSMHWLPHKIDVVFVQLCMQVGSAWKCGAISFQAGYLVHQSKNYSH